MLIFFGKLCVNSKSWMKEFAKHSTFPLFPWKLGVLYFYQECHGLQLKIKKQKLSNTSMIRTMIQAYQFCSKIGHWTMIEQNEQNEFNFILSLSNRACCSIPIITWLRNPTISNMRINFNYNFSSIGACEERA